MESANPTLIKTLRSSRSLLSVKEVAALLGKSPSRLSEAVKLGKIPAYRIGKDYRFDPGELAN
jgi:excisionase family DNA binding protein